MLKRERLASHPLLEILTCDAAGLVLSLDLAGHFVGMDIAPERLYEDEVLRLVVVGDV